MITFTEKDFNLTKIKRESKLFNLLTKNKYHVYGLRQEENPPVLIEFDNDFVDATFRKSIDSLISFFKSNGIDVEIFDESESRKVDIGLRKDIRAIVNKNESPVFASSILSTIVYCLENRIDLDQLMKYRLSSIPKSLVKKS